MKKLLSCFSGLLLATVVAHATPLFSDNFNSYTAGNLAGTTANGIGQGTWAQDNTSAAAPIQVTATGGVGGTPGVSLAATGQDVYAPLTAGTITLNTGDTLFMGIDIAVASVANTSGDYFMHWANTVGNTGTFIDRLYVKASGTGYVLGWAGSSGANVYGTTVLSFGTAFNHVVTAYTVVSGAANDTGAIYVNPTDPIMANNTAYLSSAWTAGAEATGETVAQVDLRQGANGPVMTVDNLTASLAFGDVIEVPEPGCLSLLGGFGLLAWHLIRRRK